MCLYAQIGRHPGEEYLIYMPFTKLQYEVILLGPVHLMRRRKYCLAVK